MIDVFFNRKYCELYEVADIEVCNEFVFNSEYGTVKNLHLIRKIPTRINNEQYFDTITPYGYGGPYITDTKDIKKLTNGYNLAWKSYCAEHNIVSEFIRFHLFDNEEIRHNINAEVCFISNNIVVDTTIPMEEAWLNFEHKVRKNVKKAHTNNLTVIHDDTGKELDNFLEIYYSTMERNNASDYYYFDREYFEKINRGLKGSYVYFHTVLDGEIISTELVLCSEKYAYSFLGGTKSEYYDLRPNDLLKYDIISWCNESGKEKFILGGGYHKDDGIYRYKKAFAPDGDVPFYIGKKIHNEKIYNALVGERKKESSFDSESSFFPLYRL